MMKERFWSLAELKQPVNQWLCIAFLGVWCFWILLYYSAKHAELVGAAEVSPVERALNDTF